MSYFLDSCFRRNDNVSFPEVFHLHHTAAQAANMANNALAVAVQPIAAIAISLTPLSPPSCHSRESGNPFSYTFLGFLSSQE